MIKIRQDVLPTSLERVAELAELGQGRGYSGLDDIDQLAQSPPPVPREWFSVRGHDLLIHPPRPPHVRMRGISEHHVEAGLLFLRQECLPRTQYSPY